jgi:hypothetical protein
MSIIPFQGHRETSRQRYKEEKEQAVKHFLSSDLEAVEELDIEQVVKWRMTIPRTAYPIDVSDEEWTFVAAYLTLLPARCRATHLQPARSV